MPNKETPELPGLLGELKGRGDGLKSPDTAYFEVLAKNSLRDGRQPASLVSFQRWQWMAAAAMVLLLLGGWVVLQTYGFGHDPLRAEQQLSSEELLNQLSTEDINAYIDEQLDEFEPELYAEAPLNQ